MVKDLVRIKMNTELSTVHEKDFDELAETLTKENIYKLNRQVQSNKKAILQQYVDSDSDDEKDWDIESNESFNKHKNKLMRNISKDDHATTTKQYNRRILSNSSTSSNTPSSVKSRYSESDTDKSDYELEYDGLGSDIDLMKLFQKKQIQTKNETLARHALNRLERINQRSSPRRHHNYDSVDNYSKDSDFDDIEEIDLNKLQRFDVSPVKINKKQSLPSLYTNTSLTGSPRKVKRYQSNLDMSGSSAVKYPIFTGHELDQVDDEYLNKFVKSKKKIDHRKGKIDLSRYAEPDTLAYTNKSNKSSFLDAASNDTKLAKLTREGRLRVIRSLNKPKVRKFMNGHLYGELEYDPVLQKWKGNEEELVRFESLNKSIPKLINNNKNELPQIVGDMVYDNKKLKWVHIKGGYPDDPFGDDFDVTFKKPSEKIEGRGISGRLVPSESTLALSNKLSSRGNYFKVTPDMYRIWKHEEERWIRKVSNWFPNDTDRYEFKYELKRFLNKQ